MRRIFLLVLCAGLLLASFGCGGGGFLGLKNREAYLLVSPTQLQLVKLKTGELVGAPVLLDAPAGITTICFRSLSGQLYGLGGDKKLYKVNGLTGKCFSVNSTPLAIADTSGTLFSNAEGTKLYYIGGDQKTYEISPGQGTVTNTGATAAYAGGDVNSNPVITGATFTPSGNSLFVIDTANAALAKMDTPLGGVLHTVGSLGPEIFGKASIGIDPQLRDAYMVSNGSSGAGLYKINLTSGALTLIAPDSATGIAVIP